MISIIMAAYNVGNFIQQSINSVINQSFADWELLIIDDGSTDHTKRNIKEFQDPRIKYFYQENQGVSAARNQGLRHMSGEYFCFLDADDYLPSGSIEPRYRKLEQFPEIDFLDGKVKIFDRNFEKMLDQWEPSFQGEPLNQLLNLSGSCFWGLTWMIRRKANKIYHFNENLTHGEDLLFYIDLALDGGTYDYTEEEVLHYRKGHPSAMKNLSGLENGYHLIYHSLKDNEKIPTRQLTVFKEKARDIVFKSYLGNYQFMNAFFSLLRKW